MAAVTAAVGALVGGAALSARAQRKAAGKAADRHQESTDRRLEFERGAHQDYLDRTQPFVDQASELSGGMGGVLDEQRLANEQGLPELNLEVLDSPLFKKISDDVSRRVMSNRAGRGMLMSGGTADALQSRLAPLALEQAQRQQALEIGHMDRMNQLRQSRFSNMYGLFQSGANAAGAQGAAGMSSAANQGAAVQDAATVGGQTDMMAGQARAGVFDTISGLGGFGLSGGFSGGINRQMPTGELYGGGGFRPNYVGGQAAGPLLPSGRFSR